ncbi:MAG: ROK family protein [Lachnospiraceae bacterium]|nr:ROK family protein [Lachnospiraceae bacterium]
MNDVQYIVSVDIGKTKIAAGLFNIDLVLEDYIVKPSGKCAQEILALVESIIKYYIERYSNSILGIGLASFGVVDFWRGSIVSSGIIADWNNIPIKQQMESLFHIPVFVENDVKAAAFGEFCVTNISEKHKGLLYLSIGTSIGLAFVEDTFLWHGAHQRFGEIASFRPANSQLTLGEMIGGKGLIEQYYKHTQCIKTGNELFSLATAGDTFAKNIFEVMITTTAELLRWLSVCFDPGCLIIGGGVVCNNTVLFDMIQDCYKTISNKEYYTLSVAKLREKSGIYGAAELVIQNTIEDVQSLIVKENNYV